MENPGDLMYCFEKRKKAISGKNIFQGLKHLISSGTITCCFENYSCVKDWKTMQNRVYKTAKWAHISHCQTEFTESITYDFWNYACKWFWYVWMNSCQIGDSPDLSCQPKCKSVFRQYLTDPDKYLDTQVSLFIIYQKRDQVNCAKLKYSGYE